MIIVVSVKVYFLFFMYWIEFVLIILIVFKIVCGFNNEMDVVKRICFFKGIFFFCFILLEGLFF